jgi:2'-5' RNA ligase
METSDDKNRQPVEETCRLFIAVPFPSEIKEQCGQLVSRLQTAIRFAGAHPAWVKTQSLHLTLLFLGATNPLRCPEILSLMEKTSKDVKHFNLRLAEVSLFPNPKNPRVIALNLFGELLTLQALQNSLHSNFGENGFQFDSRPFRPHVTLARLKSMRGLAGVRDVVNSHRDHVVGEVRVTKITLYRSHLLPDGAEYEVVAETPLMAP